MSYAIALSKVAELMQKTQQLETENAALREDKERLDSGMIRLRAFSEWGNEWCIHTHLDLRAAIDAARAEEAKP